MREAPAADPVALYAQMCRIRAVEESLGRLWRRGLISGEMHFGTGEEAVVAGVLAHVEDGDALALDYRSTPPLVARGVELVSLFLEVLGDEGGLCRATAATCTSSPASTWPRRPASSAPLRRWPVAPGSLPSRPGMRELPSPSSGTARSIRAP